MNYQVNFIQQFKNFPKLILITLSAKKTPSYRNGNQKLDGVFGHHTPLGELKLPSFQKVFNQ